MNQILPLSVKLLFLAVPVLSAILSIVLASAHYKLQENPIFPYSISIALAFFELLYSISVFVPMTLSDSRSRDLKLIWGTCIFIGFLGSLISGIAWLGNLISFNRDILVGKEKETRAIQVATLIFWSFTMIASSSYMTALFSQTVINKAEFGFSGLYQLRDGIRGHKHVPSHLTVNFEDDFPGVPVTELKESPSQMLYNSYQPSESKYSPTLYNPRFSVNTIHDDYHPINGASNDHQASPKSTKSARGDSKIKRSGGVSPFRNSIDTVKLALKSEGSPSSVSLKSKKNNNASTGSSIETYSSLSLKLFDTHEPLSLNCNMNGLDIGTSEISPTGTIISNNSQDYGISDYKQQRNLNQNMLAQSLPFSAHKSPEEFGNSCNTAGPIVNGVHTNRKSFGIYGSSKRALPNHFPNTFRNKHFRVEDDKQLMTDYMQPNTLRKASGILDLHYNPDRRESYGQNILAKLPQSILPSQLRNDSFSSINTSPKRAKFQSHFSKKSQPTKNSSYFDPLDNDLMEIPVNPNSALDDNTGKIPTIGTRKASNLHNLRNHRKHEYTSSENEPTLGQFSIDTTSHQESNTTLNAKDIYMKNENLKKPQHECISANNDFDSWELNSVVACEQLLWSMSNMDTVGPTTPMLRNVSGSSTESGATNISNSNPLATPEMFLSYDRKSWCSPATDITKTTSINDSPASNRAASTQLIIE